MKRNLRDWKELLEIRDCRRERTCWLEYTLWTLLALAVAAGVIWRM